MTAGANGPSAMLPDLLRPNALAAAPARCKICGAHAPLEGVVNFHKNCMVLYGQHTPLSGIPVYYRRCDDCGFLFTTLCDDWQPEDFRRHIYNADYAKVDPEYAQARPARNAASVGRVFRAHAAGLRLLDYGGGNGGFAAGLRALGYDVAGYDPFDGDTPQAAPGPYDLITCLEVVEHVPDPQDLTAQIARRLAPGGMVLFSTLLQPPGRTPGALDWWYIAPRNGHVSIHTAQSLALLWARVGLRVITLNHGVHVACRTVPDWAGGIAVVAGTTSTRLAEAAT